MPSPLGHAMAGAAIGWIAEIYARRSTRAASPVGERHDRAKPQLTAETADRGRRSSWLDAVVESISPLAVACAALAVMPDFDMFFGTHRTYSHSLGAAAIVWVLVAFVARRLRLPVVKVATVCAAAYASHVFLDWLGHDDSRAGGLMVFWPASRHTSRSGLNLFLEYTALHRRHVDLLVTFARNAHALAREMLILGPPFLLVWLVRVKTFARLASELSRRDEAA